MSRIVHKLKLIPNKIAWYFKLLSWARTHAKEVDNYKFLIKLRNIAHEKKLVMEREEKKDKALKLEIQVNLIDKILNYVNR